MVRAKPRLTQTDVTLTKQCSYSTPRRDHPGPSRPTEDQEEDGRQVHRERGPRTQRGAQLR